MVLKTGFEPASLAADAPKASVCAVPPLEHDGTATRSYDAGEDMHEKLNSCWRRW